MLMFISSGTSSKELSYHTALQKVVRGFHIIVEQTIRNDGFYMQITQFFRISRIIIFTYPYLPRNPRTRKTKAIGMINSGDERR
jgi:hypothetical protein